jgi:O-antigen/teichoic acid export membrane protein
MVVGLAVNLIVMQQSIRATEFGGDEARRMQLSRQVSVPFALITPTAVGFYLIQPTFTLFAVPETYRLIYEANVGWASLAAALLGLRLFSVDPLFIAAGRSRLTVLGPLASLFITSAGVWLGGGIFGYNDRLISAATAVGLGGGLLVSTFMAMWKLDIRWPYRDVIITLIATTAMSAVFLLVVSGTSIMRCMGAIVLASVTYGLVCWVLNLCSVRDLVSVRLKPS